jgi:hypothetical protein
MLTGFMKRGAEKEVLAIGSMAQEKYFREAVLFNVKVSSSQSIHRTFQKLQ